MEKRKLTTYKTTVTISSGIQEEDTAGLPSSLTLAFDQHDPVPDHAVQLEDDLQVRASEQERGFASAENPHKSELDTNSQEKPEF